MTSRKYIDGEDEITYGVTALTKKQVKMKSPPASALTVEALNADEAKGIARGMLEANHKYVYAFVLKVVSGYGDDYEWGIKSAEVIYDIWVDEDFPEEKENQYVAPGIN